MARKQQKPQPSEIENPAPSMPEKPEHNYRFKEGEPIANRYEVIEPLGHGGFAEVYHCRDLVLGREVAVKVLTGAEKGFGIEEARKAAKLEHSYIVQVYDLSRLEDGTPLIIFRYVAGRTLEDHLDQAQYRRLPLNDDTLRIIRQVAEALDYAHGQGVIHQDVKPSNIILDPQGNARLTDFGLAAVKGISDGESVLSRQLTTGLGGTIPYMAPERLREGKGGDELSDLYSLGVVAYEMLTGQLPYRGQGTGLVYQIASPTTEPIPPKLANPEIPEGVERVLLRALSKEPEKRYFTCTDFATELEQSAREYVDASSLYEKAKARLEARKWREALRAFEELNERAPGFRDTPHLLEQALHQVRLLELYEKAQASVRRGRYQEALDTLNILTELEPGYDVAELQRQAREGLAREERRTLDQMYQQALQQYREGKYRECLDTLAVIRQRDPSYPDPDGIERPAREEVEKEQRLRELYTRGVEQMRLEQWTEAIVTLEKLRQEAPRYEDVEARLETARHMARLSGFLKEARELLEKEQFTLAMNRLDELQRLSPEYKKDEVALLREEVPSRLYKRAEDSLRDGQFERCLAWLADLHKIRSDYPGLRELQARAQEGIRRRDLKKKLDVLYGRALEHLERRDYETALELWQQLQKERGDLEYPDAQSVGRRARDGLCSQLYTQALGALTQKDPRQALKLWRQIGELDSTYPDSQNVEKRAREMLAREERRRQLLRRLAIAGGAILLIGLIVLGGFLIFRSCSPPPAPHPSPTFTPTTGAAHPAISPTSSATPSPTPSPARSPSPSPTSTNTPTLTPTPSPTPTEALVATAIQGASIFAAPDATSRELGTVPTGKAVTILGRSAYGRWLYIRNDQGVEGYVYEPRFAWTGEYESLPIVTSTVSPSIPRPPSSAPCQPSASPPYPILEMDVWDLPGTERCEGGVWYKRVYLAGRGGDGCYTYYWEGTKLAGPIAGSVTFEVHSAGGAVIGKARVESGDGQSVERNFYISGVNCSE